MDLLHLGKTSLGVELAKKLNGEIISADSMQIYKEMNIGTAKPTKEEMEGIKHHLIDFVNPDEEYNVSKYKIDATNAIEDILTRNKTPIIVGGTGLYVNTLINGIEFEDIKSDESYKKELEDLAAEKGVDALFELLEKVDPVSAKTIEKNNIRRVIRALEIYKVTGKPKSVVDIESQKEVPYDYLVYGINWDREKLYDRINQRVDIMISQGLIDEVKIITQKYQISKTALQGLGYKEVIEYFDEKISYDEMIEKIKQESRRYAKRQMTWFKRNKNITWLPLEKVKPYVLKCIQDE